MALVRAAVSVRRRPKDIWSSRLKKNCRRGDALLRPRRRLRRGLHLHHGNRMRRGGLRHRGGRDCRLCHQPLLSLWYTLRGCSVQCFTFSYSPGGCGSWGSSLASVLQGAVAGEGRRHRGPSDLGRGYTTIHALSFEAEEKKREKKEIHALLVRAPLLLTCFLKESNIYAPAPSAALLLRLRL